MREWWCYWSGRALCRLIGWHNTSCRGRPDHLDIYGRDVLGWRRRMTPRRYWRKRRKQRRRSEHGD